MTRLVSSSGASEPFINTIPCSAARDGLKRIPGQTNRIASSIHHDERDYEFLLYLAL